MSIVCYQFRFYPNQEQIDFFNQSIGSCRFLWNKAVERNIKQYKEDKSFVFYHQLASELTNLKKEHTWLKDINSQSLQQTLKKFEVTLKKTYSKTSKGGFPKFKSKKDSAQSFIVPQFFKVVNDTLKIPKLKSWIKFKKHRDIQGTIKTVTIKKDIDQWYVSFACEVPNIEKKPVVHSVGIDLGIKTFACTSDGEYLEYKHDHGLDRKTKHYQRILSRKIKGSNNRHWVRIQLSRLHRKQARKRKDFHCKTVSSIAKNYDCVSLESLNVKGMVKNKKLSKAIHRQGWSQFNTLLKNKFNQLGKTIIEIGRFYPSSKTCSSCGWINADLKLDHRHWTCTNCNEVHDRDFNAALNIHKEGLRLISLGTSDYTSGDSVPLGNFRVA